MKNKESIFKNSPFGYALHKIILDEKGKPVDYKFLEVNEAFEKLTGLKQADIIGKNVTEAIPGIEKDKFDWIGFYGKIALEQKEETFEQFSEPLRKHYKVQVYAPQKEYFVTIFTDITAEKSISQIAAKLNTFDSENIDLQYIADKARELSGAKYAVLNKFDENGRDFSSIALSGANEHIEKAASILGFDIVGKKWEYDAERQKKTAKQKTTIFEKLTDLSGSVIPQKTTDILCKTFNIGEVVLVKITRNNIMLADFTLIFERGKHLENKEIVETYADLTGILLSRIDEQKKNKENEERLSLAMDAAENGFWDWDMKNNNIYFSPKWYTMLGYEYKELPMHIDTWKELMHPEDKKNVLPIIQKYLNTGKKYAEEFRLRCKDGSYKWISGQGKSYLIDKSGKPYRAVGIHVDITERKKAEEKLIALNQQLEANNQQLTATEQQLRALNQQLEANNQQLTATEQQLRVSEERLNAFINAVPDIICYKDGKGRWLLANQADLELFSLTGVDYYGKTDAELAEYTHEIYKESFSTCIITDELAWNNKTPSRRIEIIPTVNGITKIYDVIKIPTFNADGSRKGLAVIGRDITERKQAEEKLIALNQQLEANNQQLTATEQQLRATNQQLIAKNRELKESESRFKALHNASFGGIAIHDRGVILDCNKGLSEMTGYKEDELIGMDGLLLIAEESRQRVKEHILSGYEKPYEAIGIRKNGEKYPLQILGKQIPYKGKIARVTEFRDITERKKAEQQLIALNQQLEASEKKYREFFEKDLTGDFLSTVDGKLIDCNPAFIKILGYDSIEELKQVTLLPIYKNKTERDKLINLIKKNGEVINYETSIIKKDGSEIFIVENVLGEFNKEGNLTHLRGYIYDITERKKAEQQLRELNQQLIAQNKELLKLSTAIKQSPSVITITDTKGNIEFVNPKFTEITGYTFDEVVNKNPRILKSGYTTKEEYKNLWKTISSGKEWRGEFQNKKKNGELYWERAYISPIFDEHGKIINYIKVAEDITEQKLSIQALKENEEKFRTLFNQVNDAVFMYDPETFKIIDANEATSRIYGYSSEELKGMSVLEFSAEVEKSKSAVKTINKKGEIKVDIRRHKKKDGTDLYVELQGYKMIINNKPIAFAVCHDITERVKYEKELRAALEKAQESDRLKSAFLANMSHEIRTPMNGILGFTELLKEPHLTGEQQRNYIQIIEKSGKRLLNTINDIIDISKIEAGMVEVVNSEVSINEVLKEQYAFFNPEAQQKGLELVYQPTLSDEEATVTTDKHKLEGILTNLIKNAIKYTDHGSISFGCSLKKEKDTRELEFFVKDTGIGIPSDRIHAIFNRFEQADIEDRRVMEGSGLGLAIAKSYVEMLGGKIWVESEEGLGSTFYFTLPASSNLEEKSGKAISAQSEKTEPKVKGMKILIAEDDELSRKYISLIVKDISAEILEAETGIKVLELCRQHKDIDLILMDIRMPGINGYEATRQIREFNKDVIIIAQTAFALSGDREKAIEAGCNDYISKPIKKADLLEKIRKYT